MPVASTPWVTNRYPPARRSDHVDAYKSESKGEVRVHDPYDWLEKNTSETEEWTTTQAGFAREYLDKNPERKVLEDEVRKNTDFAKFSPPSLKGDGRWYWTYNSGLQGHPVIYRSQDDKLPDFTKVEGPGGEPFFDSNLLSSDGSAALATAAFSHCGKFYAYGISRSGSDFYTIYIRPTSADFVAAGDSLPSHDDQRLSEEIRYVKFCGIMWTHDSKGFFYQRFPSRESHGTASDDLAGTETDKDKHAMLYYHRIGTDQSEDVLVLRDDLHPEWMWGAGVTEVDGRYLMLTISRDTARKNAMWITDLEKNEIGPNMQWDKLIDEYEAAYYYIANDGTKFYLMTNKDAPRYRLVSVDLADPPDQRMFKDVIPEDEDALLDEVLPVNKNSFVVRFNRNVKDEIYLYTMDGRRLYQMLPDFVGTSILTGRREHPWFFATLTGFTNPGIVLRYDFNEKEQDEAKKWSVYRKTLVQGLNSDDFLVQQVWFNSKDGTKVPMFIVRHKDTKLDGTAPAIQYAYGGFAMSVVPFFSASYLSFVKMYGAVMAVVNIRGGNEFGEEWHYAGARERKINCSDDFIAATQYLVDNKFAAPGKVAIHGASNGGLLVGTCINRAPEGLIGAALAEVGVMDLLKFADFTIGRAWMSDFGNPHDPHDFDYIYPISPLHNIPTAKVLPPTMVLTADHDDRVVPLHSFKYAAALQHLHPDNPHPLIIRIEKKAGHGAGKSTEKRIQDSVDKFGFIVQSLGLTFKRT
ncbi:hypothetical protein SCP_0203030 [Sparassis crispa]|uniref:Prolyl endopeptidase n=1 Tax=Sparassis crispa TaxID=139825 RepID=A0A401GA92_9APHY|nr:hypothetical protein SCP_0203030 [Sparassis crispa]GBE79106.1 hypothetical protein SCP_0203030 [Sparassis crispa]